MDERGGTIRRVGLALASTAIVLTASAAPAMILNRILATVDGKPLTLYELKVFSANNIQARQLGTNDPAALLDLLVTTHLIELEIADKGISIGDADVDRYIDQVRQQNQLSEAQLEEALRQQGLDRDTYRAQIRDEMQRAQLINREIRGKVNVTPEEVERYYEAHLAQYEKDPEVTVSHIMLRLAADAPDSEVERVMAHAAEIHERLDDGESFEDAAHQYSEDPAAESGGKLGTFKVGSMLDALDDAVRNLDVGEYSEPVRSEVGVHIVRLDARSSASHQPLAGLSDEIKERLYNQALEERYKRWLTEDLRQRHHVEILE
jgi:peptidyl-prolyl cis-trans isomerase SurA